MSVKFVFEDGENTPSSILLKNTYNKNNIFFSNGSSAVLRKACSVQNSGDKVYIFMMWLLIMQKQLMDITC